MSTLICLINHLLPKLCANEEKMFRNHKINFHQSLLLTRLFMQWLSIGLICYLYTKSHFSQNYLNQVLITFFSTRASRGRTTIETEKCASSNFQPKEKIPADMPSVSKFRISLRYGTKMCI